MKLSKDDQHLLFSAPSTGPAPASTPDPLPLAAADKHEQAPTSDAHLVAMLRKAAPALWRKLDPRTLSRRDLRTRMLQLVQWLAQKNGVTLELNVRMPYVLKGSKVDGRLHAVLHKGPQTVAVELAFEPDEACLLKLRQAHAEGHISLLLVVAPEGTKPLVLGKLSRLGSGHPDLRWLEVVLLPA